MLSRANTFEHKRTLPDGVPKNEDVYRDPSEDLGFHLKGAIGSRLPCRNISTERVGGEKVGRSQSGISIRLDPQTISKEVTEIKASRIRLNDETSRTHLLFQSIKKRGRAEIEVRTVAMVAEHHTSVLSESRAKARAIVHRERLQIFREYGSKRRTRVLAMAIKSGWSIPVSVRSGFRRTLSAKFTRIEPQ